MEKVLYLMGIDWYWIKQRPQIIALELQKKYDVTVIYLKEVFSKTEKRKDKNEVINKVGVPAIPYRDKSCFASMIEHLLINRSIKDVHQYDIVWISYPTLYKYIDKTYAGQIIYDCMDKHSVLCGDCKVGNEIERIERELIQRADLIFATSLVLKQNMERLGGNGKVYLSRNGFLKNKIYPLSHNSNKKIYKIGYFGTISTWMDFSMIERSLELYDFIEYHMIGPVHQVEIPHNSRIYMEGVVEHERLYDKVKEYDCLFMPFMINEIILAVDPVKLYEYVSMGKCIISIWYEEIDRFSPFVYFYKNEQEYFELLIILRQNGFKAKYTRRQQQDFLKNNSWEVRCNEIINNIKTV